MGALIRLGLRLFRKAVRGRRAKVKVRRGGGRDRAKLMKIVLDGRD